MPHLLQANGTNFFDVKLIQKAINEIFYSRLHIPASTQRYERQSYIRSNKSKSACRLYAAFGGSIKVGLGVSFLDLVSMML